MMIKYFLLTSLTVISTQIFTTSEVLLSVSIDYATKHTEYGFYYSAYIIYFIFQCVDAMVSTLYILLTFPFTKQWYRRYCDRLDRFCLNIWTKCALNSKPMAPIAEINE